MTIIKHFPILMILFLLLTGFFTPLIKSVNKVKKVILMTFIGITIMALMTMRFVAINGEYLYGVGHWHSPWGIELKITYLATLVTLIIGIISTIIIWFSMYRLEEEIEIKRVGYYYAIFSILAASLIGIVNSNDLFNMYVFLEISALASCGIIVVKNKKENIKASIKYLILSTMGSGLILMGIAFIYSITGNLNLNYIHKELVEIASLYPKIVTVSLGMFIAGIGLKSAMFPLHIWLPDAHGNAPTTSSAMLSALVLKAYVVMLIKVIFEVFGLDIISKLFVFDILVVFGCLGMIGGSILAILQKDIKRMLAYSSVAQMGYIFLGIGLGSKLGMSAALFHILNHAITKTTLFLTAGMMVMKIKSKSITSLKGIGIEMPITTTIFSIAALSMIGIPLLVGFNSKWYFALGSLEANKPVITLVIILSSILNAVYYLPIIVNGFFGDENVNSKIFKSKEFSTIQLIPVLLLGILIVGFGIFPHGPMYLIEMISANLLNM